jgi:anti-sigma B factor antagonist
MTRVNEAPGAWRGSSGRRAQPGFRAVSKLGVTHARLVVSGEIDLATAARFEQALTAFERLAGNRRMTLDLSRISFIDVAGWRAVRALRKRVEGRGTRCVVVAPHGPARRVFEILERSRCGVA